MKPEVIIIPAVCAAICVGIGIWRGVVEDFAYMAVWFIAAALSFIPLVKAVIAARKEKKNKKRDGDKK